MGAQGFISGGDKTFAALLSTRAERMTLRRWLGAGIPLGLLSLTRENALLLIFPILLWILVGPFPGPWRARFVPSILLVAGCASYCSW